MYSPKDKNNLFFQSDSIFCMSEKPSVGYGARRLCWGTVSCGRKSRTFLLWASMKTWVSQPQDALSGCPIPADGIPGMWKVRNNSSESLPLDTLRHVFDIFPDVCV